VKILGGSSMVGSHANGSETKREPKTDIMKDRLVVLEKTIEKMIDAPYQHGEKVEWMEIEIGKMRYGFNESMQECQAT
jgi:hypothetical protein